MYCVGGVISPLLANIYLHYVLDLWMQQWRVTGVLATIHFSMLPLALVNAIAFSNPRKARYPLGIACGILRGGSLSGSALLWIQNATNVLIADLPIFVEIADPSSICRDGMKLFLRD